MVTIKECCAICENLYDADKCPLFKTYNCAAEYCVDDFDKVAKYHVCCEKFETMGEYKAAIEIAEKLKIQIDQERTFNRPKADS